MGETKNTEWAILERDAPRMQVDWFDDTIELAAWDRVPPRTEN